MSWQPIETAPKDGTHVLVSDDGVVSEAWFDAEAHGGGWYLANRHWTDGPGPDQIFPTHWQSMPRPFAEKK